MKVRCSFCAYTCLGGLMKVLGKWVWCGACSDGATFQAQQARPPSVSLEQLIRAHGVNTARHMVKEGRG